MENNKISNLNKNSRLALNNLDNVFPYYLPILKGKKGEFDAIKELPKEMKSSILPLIEIPSIAWDFVNEAPSTTIEKQVSASIKGIKGCWDKDFDILIDTYYLEENYDASNKTMNIVMSNLIVDGYSPVPVLNVNSSEDLLTTLEYKSSVCIRITINEFEDYDINNEIERIVSTLGIELSNVYLLLDMGYINESEISMAKISSRAFYSEVANIELFKEVFLSSTSFPIDLSGCKANSITTINRIEVIIFEYFQEMSDRFKRLPKFSDYCVSNPEIQEVDPRIMTMSASVRYTTEEKWYIFKAASVKKYSFDQYYELAKTVSDSKVYNGKDYSWGDSQISQKASRTGGTGSATTWRQICTNHHIHLMINFLSS